MAWSYTSESTNGGIANGQLNIEFWTHWTATELTSDRAGKVRLSITVTLDKYSWFGEQAQLNSHDQIYIGDTPTADAVEVRASTPAGADYGYSTEVYVDEAWIGRYVTFDIGRRKTIVLFNLNRQSYATVNITGDGHFGDTFALTLDGAATGYTYYVSVVCGGVTKWPINGVGPTAAIGTWTPTAAEYGPHITTAASAQATFTCFTYLNGSMVGSTTKTITVSFKDADITPTGASGWCTVTAVNTGTLLTGWIQGVSTAHVAFDTTKLSLMHGATMSQLVVYVGDTPYTVDKTATPIVFDSNTLSEQTTFVCSAIDSRNKFVSFGMQVTPEKYAPPAVRSGPAAFRSTSQGAQDEDGTYITAQVTVGYSWLDDGNSGNRNSVTAQVRTARAGTGQWSSWQNMTAGAPSQEQGDQTRYDVSFTKTLGSAVDQFSADESYDVQIVIADGISSFTRQLLVTTQEWAMKFRPTGKGVAFGKAPSADKELQIPGDWKIRIGSDELMDLVKSYILDWVFPVGSEYWTFDANADPNQLFGGTWQQVQGYTYLWGRIA